MHIPKPYYVLSVSTFRDFCSRFIPRSVTLHSIFQIEFHPPFRETCSCFNLMPSVVPNDITSRHPPFQVSNTNQVQVGTVHPVAPSVCPSSDDIITSVVFFPFPHSPPLGTVFPATGLLSRPRPLFIPISPSYYHATIRLLTRFFLLRLVPGLSFVRYSLPSHLIAMPQCDLCLNNGIHCDLVPVPTGHISPSIFVSIPVAPWPVKASLVAILFAFDTSTLPPPSVLLSYTDPSVIPSLPKPVCYLLPPSNVDTSQCPSDFHLRQSCKAPSPPPASYSTSHMMLATVTTPSLKQTS
eukprot:g38097.t1